MRDAFDAYYTPDDVAARCVATLWEATPGAVALEPSAGGGSFVRALRAAGVARVDAIDIRDTPGLDIADHGYIGRFEDFEPERGYDLIACNPPYTYAEKHIRKCLAIAPMVGALLRLGFLESEARRRFWIEHPPAAVYVLPRRPKFTGVSGSDWAAYGWYLWRRDWTTEPRLRWPD